jgi:hypothetical protein
MRSIFKEYFKKIKTHTKQSPNEVQMVDKQYTTEVLSFNLEKNVFYFHSTEPSSNFP